MGKLNYLLAEDYIKPRIYFHSKSSSSTDVYYSKDTKKRFVGLEHLTHLLRSSKGFVVNAFQIDYYQSLPRMILETIKNNQIKKKLYIVGPELSLSILKRGFKTVYDKHFDDLHYLSTEKDHDELLTHCLNLLQEGHIIYMLPEASICWEPTYLKDNDFHVIPLCSSLLSQKANVPIIPTSSKEDISKIVLFESSNPSDFNGELNECVAHQSEKIYQFLHTS